MLSLILVLMGVLLLAFSIRERAKQMYYRGGSWDKIPEPRNSPIAQALVNLLGTAGGIYLSLVMFCSFLELELPVKIVFFNIALEPMAALSIGIATVQPYVMKIYRLVKNKIM